MAAASANKQLVAKKMKTCGHCAKRVDDVIYIVIAANSGSIASVKRSQKKLAKCGRK